MFGTNSRPLSEDLVLRHIDGTFVMFRRDQRGSEPARSLAAESDEWTANTATRRRGDESSLWVGESSVVTGFGFAMVNTGRQPNDHALEPRAE